ncbi:helix-turn-helix and ligand-binding sensor domain-containing protein [Mangrovibacterium diazotrophicum]|uniref:YXYXY domain-containing protein n=1 Tax=Mangrovibacterium diazotrophicum TaxID=1261403 RepID=A0A419W9M3_9BACT|nr:triple tyrosine motif-containing protein [Mangrovibacterium diazotrophicum]RKD92160.1 YXYXY domain-containing protein [Mangrovibacterium diazotrophicum]
MARTLIILFLILLVSVDKTTAQQPSIRNFATSIYGGGTQNWCISQTDNKRMLFANNSGLLTYDSDRWFLFNIANNTNVRSLYYDGEQDYIYAGASNEFGYYYTDSITFKTTYQSLSINLPEKEQSFDEVWNIYKYKDAITFQCKRHIFLLKPDGEFSVFHTKYRIETSTVVDDKIIIACKEATYYIFNNRLHTMNNTDLLQGKSVRAILPYVNGMIIFATASDGLYTYDGFTTTPLMLDISPFLENNQIFCGAIHGDMLAFGTVRGGLVVKNISSGQNSYANVSTGLQNNTVLSLFFDSLNNIWLGLDQGISYVLTEAPYKELFGHNNQNGTGYSSLIFENKLYLATNQGLFFTPFPMPDTPIPPQPQLLANMTGQAWSLRNISHSVLCGNDDGAYQITGTEARKIPGPEGTWDFKELHHHPGSVLSCDYQGLYILKEVENQWVFSNRVEGFNETSTAFEEDSDGSIWVSHWQKGVYHLWLSDDLTTVVKMKFYSSENELPTNDNNIISKIDGKIYISSADGFYRYDSESGKLVKDAKLNATFQSLEHPLRLIETPRRDIWAVNTGSLSLAKRDSTGNYETDTLTFRSIAKRLQANLGHIDFIDENHTIFNVENGFISVNNDYISKRNDAQILIRRILGTKSTDTIFYAGTTKNVQKNIQIPHDQNSIKIEYVWPQYSSDKSISFSCYLENYDNEWTNQQDAVSKEYTQLRKGSYTFHLRGHNMATGVVQETMIKFTVLPAWYETLLAYAIYLVTFIIMMFYIFKFLKNRYDRRIHEIEMRRERQLRERETQLEIERQKKEKELIQMKKEELEIELKHKTSLLADSTMNLIRKNDMLQMLDNDLSEISNGIRHQEATHTLNRKIQNIHKSIHSNIKEDENWEKFEENFNLVYVNYMKKLTEQFPHLKMNDRKLCAYLRMGLSSKEMASLFNTSIRSIETARYRLRKKLNLGHDDNLSDFIQSL